MTDAKHAIDTVIEQVCAAMEGSPSRKVAYCQADKMDDGDDIIVMVCDSEDTPLGAATFAMERPELWCEDYRRSVQTGVLIATLLGLTIHAHTDARK